MKKFKVVMPETLLELAKCFSDGEEISTFLKSLEVVASEILFTIELIRRAHPVKTSDEMAIQVTAQPLVCLAAFCREHMDLVNQLVRTFKYTEMTEEEIQAIEKQNGFGDS